MSSIKRQRPSGAHPVYWFSFGTLPPDDWLQHAVQDLVTSFKGKLPRQVLAKPTARSSPYLLMDGLRGGSHVYTEEVHLPSVTATDAILIGDGSQSGFAVRGVDGVLGSTLIGFRAANGTNSSFLFHQLTSLFPFLSATVTGSAVPHLDSDLLDRLVLSTPREAEQAAIARILDAADTAIERTRTAVETAETLARNLRESSVANGDWPIARLGAFIADGPTNGVYRPESDYRPDGTPIIRIDSFGEGTIRDPISLRRVRLPAVLRDRFATGAGDILINRVNSLDFIGKAALVPSLPETTIFESNMMRLRVSPELRADYLIEVLLSSVAKRHWLARAKPAVNQASVNQRDVAELRFPKPSPERQEEIAMLMAQQRRVTFAFSNRLAALERLKRGLMQDLLTGRVRVKAAPAPPTAAAPSPA